MVEKEEETRKPLSETEKAWLLTKKEKASQKQERGIYSVRKSKHDELVEEIITGE